MFLDGRDKVRTKVIQMKKLGIQETLSPEQLSEQPLGFLRGQGHMMIPEGILPLPMTHAREQILLRNQDARTQSLVISR